MALKSLTLLLVLVILDCTVATYAGIRRSALRPIITTDNLETRTLGNRFFSSHGDIIEYDEEPKHVANSKGTVVFSRNYRIPTDDDACNCLLINQPSCCFDARSICCQSNGIHVKSSSTLCCRSTIDKNTAMELHESKEVEQSVYLHTVKDIPATTDFAPVDPPLDNPVSNTYIKNSIPNTPKYATLEHALNPGVMPIPTPPDSPIVTHDLPDISHILDSMEKEWNSIVRKSQRSFTKSEIISRRRN